MRGKAGPLIVCLTKSRLVTTFGWLTDQVKQNEREPAACECGGCLETQRTKAGKGDGCERKCGRSNRQRSLSHNVDIGHHFAGSEVTGGRLTVAPVSYVGCSQKIPRAAAPSLHRSTQAIAATLLPAVLALSCRPARYPDPSGAPARPPRHGGGGVRQPPIGGID